VEVSPHLSLVAYLRLQEPLSQLVTHLV
jgi:hypothetical protein